MIYGKTYREEQAEHERLKKPHEWFAWYPVSLIDGRRAWWCTVLRYRDGQTYLDKWWRYAAFDKEAAE